MVQAVLCRPLTAEERIQPQANLRGKGSVQNDIGTGFTPNTSVFLCQKYSHRCSMFIRSCIIYGI